MSEKVSLWRNAASAYTKDYGFNPYLDSNDADTSVNADLTEQKQLAEELNANHPVFRAIINNATNHTILSGISVSVDTSDDKLNDALEKHIKRWSETKACDAAKRLDLSGIFQATIRNYYMYGESFGLIVNTSQKYPISFRGLDWRQFAEPRDGEKDRIVRNGVELDAFGKALRIWLNGSRGNIISKPYSDSDGNPIVLHCFRQDFFGQSHGIVPVTSIYKMLLDLSVFIKTEVNVAAISAQYNMLIKKANPVPMMNQLGQAEVANGAGGTIKTSILPVRANQPLILTPGDAVEQFKMDRPNGMFQPFTEYINKICCAAFGLSYEYLFSSWADSNFSSARINALQTQAVIRANQKLAIESTIMPLVRALVMALIDTGVVDTNIELDAILESIKIIYPQLPLLDPQREIAAATARIDANLSNLQIEAEKMGLGDYMTILQQKAREEDEKKAIGLGGNVAPPDAPGAKPGEGSTRG